MKRCKLALTNKKTLQLGCALPAFLILAGGVSVGRPPL